MLANSFSTFLAWNFRINILMNIRKNKSLSALAYRTKSSYNQFNLFRSIGNGRAFDHSEDQRSFPQISSSIYLWVRNQGSLDHDDRTFRLRLRHDTGRSGRSSVANVAGHKRKSRVFRGFRGIFAGCLFFACFWNIILLLYFLIHFGT